MPYLLIVRYYWRSLIGACGTWFLYDFVTIPNSVFSGSIISTIVPEGDIKSLKDVADAALPDAVVEHDTSKT